MSLEFFKKDRCLTFGGRRRRGGGLLGLEGPGLKGPWLGRLAGDGRRGWCGGLLRLEGPWLGRLAGGL